MITDRNRVGKHHDMSAVRGGAEWRTSQCLVVARGTAIGSNAVSAVHAAALTISDELLHGRP
jgi:hypothetical protein